MRFECSQCHGILALEGCEPGEQVACGRCGSAVYAPSGRLSPGAVVGEDFVIREKLGEGGMGSVYLAHQVSLDRPAAVKVLHPEYAADKSFVEDLLNEARAAAGLNHPNIVQAYAVGGDEGIFYFAMEYVEGKTLKETLAGKGLSSARVLTIGLEIAEALAFAWKQQQLVHRDIKPDNIIMTPSGHAKLADLGLARWVSDVQPEAGTEVYGTPQYIAPEQLVGAPGDHRSDIYSLGATLYHALTGSFPYRGTSAQDVASKHLSDPLVPPAEMAPEVPENLSRIVEIMLSKRPEHRYSGAVELVKDLKRAKIGKAPQKHLAKGAQEPISVDEEGPALRDGESTGVGGRFSRRKKKRRTLKSSIGSASSGSGKPLRLSASRGTGESGAGAPAAVARTGVKPPVAGAAPVGAPESSGALSRRGVLWILIGIGIQLALMAGPAAMMVLTLGLLSGPPPPDVPPPVPDLAQVAARRVGDIAGSAASGAPTGETVAALATVAGEFGPVLGGVPEYFTLAGPLVAADVEAHRRAREETERRQWAARSRAVKEAAAEDEIRRINEAQQEERRRRQQEQADREEQERLRRREALSAERDALRTDLLELCREHNYLDARSALAGMLASNDGEFRAWAQARQVSLDRARKLYDAVYNSKDLLAGTPLPMLGGASGLRVTHIGTRAIELKASAASEPVSVPLGDMHPLHIYRLAARLAELGKLDAAEWHGLLYAYYICRGEYLGPTVAEIRKRAGDGVMGPEERELVEEASAIEAAAAAAAFAGVETRVKAALEQGNRALAAAQCNAFVRDYPNSAEEYRTRIADLLGGR